MTQPVVSEPTDGTSQEDEAMDSDDDVEFFDALMVVDDERPMSDGDSGDDSNAEIHTALLPPAAVRTRPLATHRAHHGLCGLAARAAVTQRQLAPAPRNPTAWPSGPATGTAPTVA